jgi:hypothetical protein
MSPEHPAAKAAMVGEQEIGAHVAQEIAIAIKGLQIDLRLAQERVAALEQQRLDLQDRLLQLANVRAEYGNLVVATKHRSDILKTAQQELSEAQAGQAAARTSSLITLIDAPDAGSKPSGPGRTTIVLAGFMAGALVGLGILFLTIQPSPVAEVPSEPLSQRVIAPAQETTASVAPAVTEPEVVVEPRPVVVTSPVAVTGPIVAASPAPARTKTTVAGGQVPAGSLSLKRALQKLDGGQSAWN